MREYLCRKKVANVGSAGFVYRVEEGREGGVLGGSRGLCIVGNGMFRVSRKTFRRVWRLLHGPEAGGSIDISAFPKEIVCVFDSQTFEICTIALEKELMAKEFKTRDEAGGGPSQPTWTDSNIQP